MPKNNYKSIIGEYDETEKKLYKIFSFLRITEYKTPSVPESKNFSELEAERIDYQKNGPNGFDISDDGQIAEKMLSSLHADAILIDLLCSLNDRQKIIVLYQLLRDAGYNLNHGDCAKTLSMTREHYMFLLKNVKEKSVKVLQGTGK